MALAIETPGVILLVQAVVPEDSEHKRDLWLAWVRYRDRRAERKRGRTGRNRHCHRTHLVRNHRFSELIPAACRASSRPLSRRRVRDRGP